MDTAPRTDTVSRLYIYKAIIYCHIFGGILIVFSNSRVDYVSKILRQLNRNISNIFKGIMKSNCNVTYCVVTVICIIMWGGKGYSRATFLPLSYFPFTVLIANYFPFTVLGAFPVHRSQ